MAEATSETLLTYWRNGAAIVEVCLAKAERADPLDAPMPLHGADAKLWHRAQMEAYRHAIEMMAPPENTTEADLARCNSAFEPRKAEQEAKA